jgi:membrane protein YdbS with pleckstrin-like domain
MPSPKKEPTSMTKRFLSFCLAVFAGITLLYFAVQLLSQFWGWLVLLAAVAAVIYIVVLAARARRSRW